MLSIAMRSQRCLWLYLLLLLPTTHCRLSFLNGRILPVACTILVPLRLKYGFRFWPCLIS
jgi:hypothetical protein